MQKFFFLFFKVSRPLNLVVSHSPISTATPITVQETPKKEQEQEKEESSAKPNTDPQSQAASGSKESSGLCSPNLELECFSDHLKLTSHFIIFFLWESEWNLMTVFCFFENLFKN